jgi:hypothetical protein
MCVAGARPRIKRIWSGEYKMSYCSCSLVLYDQYAVPLGKQILKILFTQPALFSKAKKAQRENSPLLICTQPICN